MAEIFLGRPRSASGWGCRLIGAICPPYLFVGHEGRRDHLCLTTVVTVRAARPLEGSAEGGVAESGPVHDTNPDLPPLQPLASAIERGAVLREDAGQQCTVAGPLVVVGGGGCFCCFAFCLITTSVYIPLGLGSRCGTCGVGTGYSGE